MLTHITNKMPMTQDEEYQLLVDWQDLVIRALRNPRFSDVYLRLYLSLTDTYPQLLTGEKTEIEVWKVRANAGEVKESSTTRFFQDLSTIGALVYESGYDKKSGQRKSYVTPLPDFDAPECFDTKATDRKRRAREAEEKRRKQFRNPLQVYQCEQCGSEDVTYDVVAKCNSCHHVHQPIKDIPASMITIQAEVIEIQDEMSLFDQFLDEQPTAKLIAIRPVAQQLPMVEQPRPRSLPARPDEKCVKCGRLRRDCFENSEGTWWYSCTPDMWDAYEKSRK